MFAIAARLFAKRGGALLLTASIALLPALVLRTAIIAFVHYRIDSTTLDAETRVARAPGERQGRLRDTVDSGDLGREPTQETRLERALDAISDLTRSSDLEGTLIAAALCLATLPLIAAGISLALAALTPLVLRERHGACIGAEECWAIAGKRIGALFGTLALACTLSFLGMFLCVLPGLGLLLGFAFAAPVTMLEGKRGVAALGRSISLAAAVLPQLLLVAALFLLLGGGAALLADYLLLDGTLVDRMLLTAAFSTLLFPLPLAALALLYDDARGAQAPAPAQYIRRRSAPG